METIIATIIILVCIGFIAWAIRDSVRREDLTQTTIQEIMRERYMGGKR